MNKAGLVRTLGALLIFFDLPLISSAAEERHGPGAMPQMQLQQSKPRSPPDCSECKPSLCLCLMCKVYAMSSEDMDSLTFGAPRLIRNLMAAQSQKLPINDYEYSKVACRQLPKLRP